MSRCYVVEIIFEMRKYLILRITHNALAVVILLSMSCLTWGCTREEEGVLEGDAAGDSSVSTYEEEYWEW